MFSANGAIGVMDSGVGGVSVLRSLMNILPHEDYIYYGDVKNAPYGKRSATEIRRAVLDIARELIFMGCKALVVACNTATAVAVEHLREEYPWIPIVGLEPAVRPALRYAKRNGGDVLVLATSVTVREKRFLDLCRCACDQLGGCFLASDGDRDICVSRDGETALVAVETQELVGFVEKGMVDGSEVVRYLSDKLLPYRDRQISAVVAGCTHFPFAEKEIAAAIGYRVRFFDGGDGAARRLEHLLKNKNELRKGQADCGTVTWICSEKGERVDEYIKTARKMWRG